MSKSKKHHYIPACYLKGFTNGGKRTSLFWAFPTDKPGTKHGANPMTLASKTTTTHLKTASIHFL